MNVSKIGYFTADALETHWTSLAVIRDRFGTFYSVEILPDKQVFSESSITNSNFELPKIDFIKKRQFAELRDKSFISIVEPKEITSAQSVTVSLINSRYDGPIWQFIEKQISAFLRSTRYCFVNGTIVTIKLINGDIIKVMLEGNMKTPKWYSFSPTSRIQYVQGERAYDCITYPTFDLLFERMKKLICYSLFNAERPPKLMDLLKKEYDNPHPHGCLFSGADGSGRSFLAKKACDALSLPYMEIDAQNFDSTNVKFEELQKTVLPKTVVVLKNFDIHFNGEETSFQKRLEAQLCQFVDRNTKAFFIMTILSKDSIPLSLQNANRFGSNLTFPPLSSEDIKTILGNKFPQSVVDQAAGCTALTLVNAVRSGFPDDIYDANGTDPTSIKGSVAHTEWSDIGGLSETKRIIREAVEWPLTRKEELKKFGIKPPRGVLLHGPPGCGKTMIARAIATSLSSAFFSISAATVFQMYLGESERVIRELFDIARQHAPAVIFIDEIDAMVGKRGKTTGVSERVLSTFLNEMDGISALQDVVIVAATNRPDALDEALMRPGRFDCLVEVLPAQNEADLIEILKVCTKKMPLADGALEYASKNIPIGSSGAVIDNICREAALCALYSGLDVVTANDFETAISKNRG